MEKRWQTHQWGIDLFYLEEIVRVKQMFWQAS